MRIPENTNVSRNQRIFQCNIVQYFIHFKNILGVWNIKVYCHARNIFIAFIILILFLVQRAKFRFIFKSENENLKKGKIEEFKGSEKERNNN